MFKGLLLVFVVLFVLVVAFCDLLEVGFTSTSKAQDLAYSHSVFKDLTEGRSAFLCQHACSCFYYVLLLAVQHSDNFCTSFYGRLADNHKAAAGLFNHVAKCVSGFFDFFLSCCPLLFIVSCSLVRQVVNLYLCP